MTGGFYHGEELVTYAESSTASGSLERDNVVVRLNSGITDIIDWREGFPVSVVRCPTIAKAAMGDGIDGQFKTGLTTIWPSEQLLAAVAASKINYFRNKRVIELAAGYHGYAGLLVAKYGRSQEIHITDGESHAAAAIDKSVDSNELNNVRSGILKFEHCEEYLELVEREKKSFDVVLASDCVLWDHTRSELLYALNQLLTPSGVVLLTAPVRRGTLSDFLQTANQNGFYARAYRNRKILSEPHKFHDDDVHSPLLAVLTRSCHKENVEAQFDVPNEDNLQFEPCRFVTSPRKRSVYAIPLSVSNGSKTSQARPNVFPTITLTSRF